MNICDINTTFKNITNIRLEEVITSVEKVSFKLPTMLIK